jgi:hypothetical protein
LSNFHRHRLRVHCISRMSVAVPNEFALLVQGLYFLKATTVADEKVFLFFREGAFLSNFQRRWLRVRGISNLTKFSAAQAQGPRYLKATRCC